MSDFGHVNARSTGSSTEYTITGDLQFVLDAIERIKANYHPLGYGTQFTEPKRISGGDWQAFGSRANSCD